MANPSKKHSRHPAEPPIAFPREKTRALGLVALVIALPLPLNEPRPEGVVGWGTVMLFVLAAALGLHRNWSLPSAPLSAWSLNLLGLVYMPILVLDLMALAESQPLRPMVRLVLFVTAVKLHSLRRERDKWHCVVGLFFVFVTAMATSASPGIVFYLLASLILGIYLLHRFATLHLLDEQTSGADATWTSSWRLGLVGAVVVVVLATPLFVALPRFSQPFVLGRGIGNSSSFSTGFSDEVSLDVIGRIRSNREVALRIEYGAAAPPTEVRLRGAAYDVYLKDRWERAGRVQPILPQARGFVLAPEEEVAQAVIWLEPLGARALIVPQETVRVDFGQRIPLLRDRAAGLILRMRPESTLRYEIGRAAEPVAAAPPPMSIQDPARDRAGVSERILELTRSVVAESDDPYRRARLIERHLSREYGYTLDFVGREGINPVEEFLFDYRSGHCEYFATAMVLMLRGLDIPARFVTGFLGGEESLGYWIVRQANAHAWVEAWFPERGWVTFDPTPPAGRPGEARRSLGALLRQAYDYALFSWDRYVISFSQGDQARALQSLRAWLRNLFQREEGLEPPTPTGLPATTADGQSPAAAGSAGSWWWLSLLPLGVLCLLWWRHTRSWSMARVYQALRLSAAKAGVAIDSGTPPFELARRLVERLPHRRNAIHSLIALYVEVSFAQREPAGDEVAAARVTLGELRGDLRRRRPVTGDRPARRAA